MTATPRLAITELVSAQAVPEATVNEGLLILEFFANGCHFKSRATTAEPGSPAEGDCYLLPVTPTGTHWSGNGGKIAIFYNGAWSFKAAKEGFIAWIDDEDIVVAFDGASWNSMSAAAEATDSDVWTATDATKRVSPRRVISAAVSQALTDGATITPDFNTGFSFHVTLGGNRTLANPTNIKAGQAGRIRVVQDGTGTRTLAYGSAWKFPGGAPTLSTAAGAVDVIAFYCHSTSVIEATLSKAFA